MKKILSFFQQWYRSSIKLRILSVTGLIVSLLMIIISIGILMQWRSLIIDQQEANAKAVANALSIPVIEAFIYAEQEDIASTDLLESHIQNFLDNVDNIHYISIQDTDQRIIAHSDLSRYDELITDPDILAVLNQYEVTTSIFKDEEHGWVLETLQPLRIGEKKWGSLLLGLEADSTREKVSKAFFQLLFLTLAALLVTLVLIYYFIDRIMASLRDLVVEVDKIDLNSSEPITISSDHDEIGFLVKHFDMLKKRLTHSRKELADAQYQVYQAEKLASIGRLASGVAHEVNNPLNGMRFCVYGIQKDPENKQQTKEYLTLINEGLTQIESVVTKLLGYSRQRPTTPEPVDLNRQLKNVLDLLDYRIKEKNIQVSIQNNSELGVIFADPNLVQEMLMNLLLNSLDAVDDNGSISITIGKKDKENLFISIYDNGTGISEDEQKIIFEPFYSTKETGKGTGLGLSVTLGIVESHNGSISINSELGTYTEFIITLPIENHYESIDR